MKKFKKMKRKFKDKKVGVAGEFFKPGTGPAEITRSDILKHLVPLWQIEDLLKEQVSKSPGRQARKKGIRRVPKEVDVLGENGQVIGKKTIKLAISGGNDLGEPRFVEGEDARKLSSLLLEWRCLNSAISIPLRDCMSQLVRANRGKIPLHELRRLMPIQETGDLSKRKGAVHYKGLTSAAFEQELFCQDARKVLKNYPALRQSCHLLKTESDSDIYSYSQGTLEESKPRRRSGFSFSQHPNAIPHDGSHQNSQ